MENILQQLNTLDDPETRRNEVFAFFSNKLARKIMVDNDLELFADDESNSGLECMMGTVILHGLMMAEAQAISDDDFCAATYDLAISTDESNRPTVENICPILLPVGVGLYREILAGTSLIETWVDEFILLDQCRL